MPAFRTASGVQGSTETVSLVFLNFVVFFGFPIQTGIGPVFDTSQQTGFRRLVLVRHKQFLSSSGRSQ